MKNDKVIISDPGDEQTHVYKKAYKFLDKLHKDWGENWDLIIDFFGQNVADEWDKIIRYE